uniref:RING-type domain-containing protein n=1 Tax=Moniliophthora roreri TaxID=221103 RepID=A0A0W0FLF2_MONRR
MPRGGQQSGYDSMNVCAFCIEFLQITAAGKGQLKSMPLAKLKKYAGVYNIKIDRAVEKDDLIEAIMSVRQPNGCLPLANEAYYRNYSVPNRSSARPRGLFSSRPPSVPNPPTAPPRPSQRARPEFARPDLAQDPPPVPPRPQQNYQYHYQPRYSNQPPHAHPYQTHYTQPPPPPPQSSRPGPYQRPTAARSSHNLNTNTPPRTPPRPRASSTHRPATSPAAAPTPPPPPPPSLDELVNMSESMIASLPISALKQVLFDNHVNARLILEKGDLVKRVVGLVEDERRERAARERREAIERGELVEDDDAESSEEEEVAEEIEELTPRRRDQPAEQTDVQASQAGANDETGQPLESSANESRLASSSPESITILPADASVSPTPAVSVSPPPEQTISTPSSIPESSASPAPPATSSTPPPPPPKIESPLPPPPPPLKIHAKPKKPHVPVERSGLCVICQDEDANIAIVDCGHLAMCRACSELVMTSSRECPLCRTRIVTEQRLLRIFKT